MTQIISNYVFFSKKAPNSVKTINKWRSSTLLKCRTSRQVCETKTGHAPRDKQTNMGVNATGTLGGGGRDPCKPCGVDAHANKRTQKPTSYFRCRVAVRKPISAKLGLRIEDVCAIFLVDNCFGVRPLVFTLKH